MLANDLQRQPAVLHDVGYAFDDSPAVFDDDIGVPANQGQGNFMKQRADGERIRANRRWSPL